MSRFNLGDIVVTKVPATFHRKSPGGELVTLQGYAYSRVVFIHPEYDHCTVKSNLFPQGAKNKEVMTLDDWELFTKRCDTYKLVNSIEEVQNLPIS